MEEVDKLFIVGFNHGFILAKEQPDLYMKHIKSIRGNPLYKQGFERGKIAFLDMAKKEKVKKKNKGKSM